MIVIPNLVQTTNGFKEVKNIKVGDKVLSMGNWLEVTEPPVKSDCYKFTLTAGFPIIIDKFALTDCHQRAFVISKYRKFSENYNSGFYSAPFITDSGYVRFDRSDSRMYKSITNLTKQVFTPLGQINQIKPIHISEEDFSLMSCLDSLESMVNNNLFVNRHDDVLFRRMNSFGALILSLLNIDVYFNGEGCAVVAPYAVYKLLDLVRNVDINIPDHIYQRAIRYNNNDNNGYYQTVKKEKVVDWCLKGLNPDINGVSMGLPTNRNYWSRLLKGKW